MCDVSLILARAATSTFFVSKNYRLLTTAGDNWSEHELDHRRIFHVLAQSYMTGSGGFVGFAIHYDRECSNRLIQVGKGT